MRRQVTADRELLDAAIHRLLRTVATFQDDGVAGPSGLPGWSRGHVLTHLARAADSRTGLLITARAGKIGRQYPSEESRAQEIEAGARRPAPVIRADLHRALDRLRDAAADHPAQLWNAPGQWLGGRQRPVHRVLPGMYREIEYHHVDLRAGYQPADWPTAFVVSQLASVAQSMTGRADCPAITIRAPHATQQIGDGALATVTGAASDLLAWLAGRADGQELQRTPPGPLPRIPPLS